MKSIKLGTYTIKDNYRTIYVNEHSIKLESYYCRNCSKKLNEVTFDGEVTYNKQKTIKFERGSFHISHYNCGFIENKNTDRVVCIIKHPYNYNRTHPQYNKFGKWGLLHFYPSKKTIKHIMKYLIE